MNIKLQVELPESPDFVRSVADDVHKAAREHNPKNMKRYYALLQIAAGLDGAAAALELAPTKKR